MLITSTATDGIIWGLSIDTKVERISESLSMKYLHKITFLLLVIGGLNWLLVGIFGWNIGVLLGGMESTGAKIFYVAIGLSAAYQLIGHMKNCRECGAK